MRKIILLSAIVSCSFALFAQRTQQTTPKKQEQKIEIKYLTEAEFIKKVYDVNAGA